MLTVIVVLLYGIVVSLDFLPKIRHHPKKDSLIYCTLLSVSFLILLLFSLDITIPGPTDTIKRLVQTFTGDLS